MQHPIYLFRHGETVWNAERRAQGHLDSPLTETGRAQARAMGRALARELALAAQPEWHNLLHYRARPLGGFESLIDDPKFFLDRDGKRNPRAELEADIAAFFAPGFPMATPATGIPGGI